MVTYRSMETVEKRKLDLDKKFRMVLETPASFHFFVTIHDFIEHIERNPFLSNGLTSRGKTNRELGIADKYDYLRKIYQGIEDINMRSNVDLGHERYMVIRELSKIQDKEVSESNSLWRKRELSRKLTSVVYERLNAHLSASIKPKK